MIYFALIFMTYFALHLHLLHSLTVIFVPYWVLFGFFISLYRHMPCCTNRSTHAVLYCVIVLLGNTVAFRFGTHASLFGWRLNHGSTCGSNPQSKDLDCKTLLRVFVLISYQFTTYYSCVVSQQHYLRKMGMTSLHVIV